MLRIPNPPEPDVPVAPDEEGNIVLKEIGVKPEFAFEPRPALGDRRRTRHHRF